MTRNEIDEYYARDRRSRDDIALRAPESGGEYMLLDVKERLLLAQRVLATYGLLAGPDRRAADTPNPGAGYVFDHPTRDIDTDDRIQVGFEPGRTLNGNGQVAKFPSIKVWSGRVDKLEDDYVPLMFSLGEIEFGTRTQDDRTFEETYAIVEGNGRQDLDQPEALEMIDLIDKAVAHIIDKGPIAARRRRIGEKALRFNADFVQSDDPSMPGEFHG